MTDAEWEQYRRDGYVVRRGVFDGADLEALRTASEEVIAQLVAMRTGRRLPAGSYTFQFDLTSEVTIKWEGDSEVVHGIEPFAHLHPVFQQYAEDPRFVELARDLVGVEDVALFTEKLNYKRAREGGAVVLHQDHPYWIGVADEIEPLVTMMLLLDDSTVENGCLEVVPGSHTWGLQQGKADSGFAANEMDEDGFDTTQLQPLELAAGDFVAFGPDLVHRSLPNRSEHDRRAFLYTYQPAGNAHMLDTLRRLTAASG